MTPAKRRKLFRATLALVLVMIAGLVSRYAFLGQSLPALLLGRPEGGLPAGTVLVRPIPANGVTVSSPDASANTQLSPVRASFDQLGGWKHVEGKTPIPEKVKKLDGQWVEVSGFMWSNNQIDNLTRFVLVQSLWGCCFGQTPDMNHFVDVTLESGKMASFYPDPVRVIGRLSVGEKIEDGHCVSIYRMEARTVVVR